MARSGVGMVRHTTAKRNPVVDPIATIEANTRYLLGQIGEIAPDYEKAAEKVAEIGASLETLQAQRVKVRSVVRTARENIGMEFGSGYVVAVLGDV